MLPSEEVSLSAHALPEDLSDKMQALKPEIIHYNYSFSSASGDGKRYPLMFRGHPAAENCKCSSTKSAYLLQYGIVDIFKEELVKDMEGVPYTFKYDETTTSQVKKQYDAYMSYWSRQSIR